MIRPMNRWLVRFAMSFFIISAVLLWEAYKGSVQAAPAWRIGVYLLGAMAALSLGIAGTRQKHHIDKYK
jgi:hypothetical protein